MICSFQDSIYEEYFYKDLVPFVPLLHSLTKSNSTPAVQRVPSTQILDIWKVAQTLLRML